VVEGKAGQGRVETRVQEEWAGTYRIVGRAEGQMLAGPPTPPGMGSSEAVKDLSFAGRNIGTHGLCQLSMQQSGRLRRTWTLMAASAVCTGHTTKASASPRGCRPRPPKKSNTNMTRGEGEGISALNPAIRLRAMLARSEAI